MKSGKTFTVHHTVLYHQIWRDQIADMKTLGHCAVDILRHRPYAWLCAMVRCGRLHCLHTLFALLAFGSAGSRGSQAEGMEADGRGEICVWCC